MRMPTVIEITPRPTAVTRDPFIDDLAPVKTIVRDGSR
jgi:hypothetical protein